MLAAGAEAPARLEDLRRAVRRSWRRFAKRHHPDRGGDHETFVAARQAIDILATLRLMPRPPVPPVPPVGQRVVLRTVVFGGWHGSGVTTTTR